MFLAPEARFSVTCSPPLILFKNLISTCERPVATVAAVWTNRRAKSLRVSDGRLLKRCDVTDDDTARNETAARPATGQRHVTCCCSESSYLM